MVGTPRIVVEMGGWGTVILIIIGILTLPAVYGLPWQAASYILAIFFGMVLGSVLTIAFRPKEEETIEPSTPSPLPKPKPEPKPAVSTQPEPAPEPRPEPEASKEPEPEPYTTFQGTYLLDDFEWPYVGKASKDREGESFVDRVRAPLCPKCQLEAIVEETWDENTDQQEVYIHCPNSSVRGSGCKNTLYYSGPREQLDDRVRIYIEGAIRKGDIDPYATAQWTPKPIPNIFRPRERERGQSGRMSKEEDE